MGRFQSQLDDPALEIDLRTRGVSFTCEANSSGIICMHPQRGYTEGGRQVHSRRSYIQIKQGTFPNRPPTRRKRVKMATEVDAGSKHTPADREYLDSLSTRLLMEFWNYVFSPTYIALNAAKFLDHEWVDMGALRDFLQQPARNFTPDESTTCQSVSDSVRIKIEATPFLAPVPGPPILVKAEPQFASVPRASADVKMRALKEGGREVFELLSDSEPEADDRDSDLEVMEALQHTSRSSSAIPLPDPEQGLGDNYDSAELDARPESSDEEDDSELIESDTVWLDDGMSLARIGHFHPTRKLTVQRMEYRQGPAAIYPIFRTPTGIDNDSWDWSGGGSRQTALVTFAPGEKPVDCRRIRYKCVGAHACDQLDKALRTAVRFELDSAPRGAIIAAQQETRHREGNSPEERAVLWVSVRFIMPANRPQ
ncbi:hypothetical protein B0H10DRAFT_1955479 [Mycena sp. CBHHK59/15]|nr:hypothetical protein B0H10DRAFT_1955479 [Mycena sp. CBHHK59/15]